MTREITLEQLKKHFHTILIATDGEDGFEKLKNNHVDVIFTDLYMPKLNGLKMIKNIRAINSHVSIIISSAHEEVKDLKESLKYDVSDYLVKPIEPSVLEKTLSSLIKKIIDKKNRNYFYDIRQFSDKKFVALIKIEEFEYIEVYNNQNSTDNIEQELSLKLNKQLPKECNFLQVYPLGNGEFALVKEEYHTNIQEAIVKLKNFQKEVNALNINLKELDYDISVMISVAYGDEALSDAKLGLKKLLISKRSFIDANGLSIKHRNSSLEKIKIFKMIQRAISTNNIVSYFQPIIENSTQKIVKYESLVRLINENNEVLTPFFFLDIAKKGKYYAMISSIVLENSFKALDQTSADISINLSALDIERKETRVNFIQKLQSNRVNAKRIVLEFTEEERIHNFSLIKSFIEEVKELGVKIAIDDFGVGYSSFERVLDYKPDILKIDGRLIKNINQDQVSYSIVESIVSFAQKENLETIAEYVENEEIYHTLCKLGVTHSQGYYFGKPLPL